MPHDILREVNLVRAHPEVYADYLEDWLLRVDGNRLLRPGRKSWALKEGRPAIEEAIRFLRAARPTGPVSLAEGMSRAAGDLVRDQGPRGEKGHVGCDGSRVGDRLHRYGSWKSRAAEVIQYGAFDSREIVALLVVDDGIPDRGHRQVLFDGDYRVMGAATGSHATYRTMCVITLAAGFEGGLITPAPPPAPVTFADESAGSVRPATRVGGPPGASWPSIQRTY